MLLVQQHTTLVLVRDSILSVFRGVELCTSGVVAIARPPARGDLCAWSDTPRHDTRGIRPMTRAPFWAVGLLLVSSFSAGCQWHNVPRESDRVGNEVSQAELTATGATSLFDALQRSRMRYFRP